MKQELKKILLVEDDEQIAFMTIMTLEDFGAFKVLHCDNGQDALDCIGTFAPQLVLMDVMMPEMDGPETFRHLRQLPEGRDLPVVFMTARAQTHEQKAYLALGAAGVIVKPFDPMLLADQIRDYWEQAAAA